MAAALSCDQGRAEGAHDTGNIGAHSLTAGDLLEASEHRVVVEGAALDNNMISEVGGIRDLDHLKKRILDDGVGKPG